jgi:hypothetical protein
VALHHAHQLLLHRIEGRVHPRRFGAVEVVHVVDDDVVKPIPPWSLPRLPIVTDQCGRDVHRLSETEHSLVVIANADRRLRERLVPLLDAEQRQLILILRPRSLGMVGVE